MTTVVVYATSMNVVTVHEHQADVGGYLSVSNHLTAVDKGFSKAGANLTATGSCPTGNVTFSSLPKVANTNITVGDVVYDIQVNATTNTQLLSCFLVRLTLAPSGAPEQTTTVSLSTNSSTADGWTIDCEFDVGPSLPPSPFSFAVTVA